MISLVVGAFLVALGLFAGGALVAAPLGVAAIAAGAPLWLLFPAFCAAGYALVVIGVPTRYAVKGSFVLSALLVLLALAAAIGLVLAATSLLHPVASTASLWYVLLVAGIVGCIGTAPRGAAEPLRSLPA